MSRVNLFQASILGVVLVTMPVVKMKGTVIMIINARTITNVEITIAEVH